MSQHPSDEQPVETIIQYKGLDDFTDSLHRKSGFVPSATNLLDEQVGDANRRRGRDMERLVNGVSILNIFQFNFQDGSDALIVNGDYDLSYNNRVLTQSNAAGPYPWWPQIPPFSDPSGLPDFSSFFRTLSKRRKYSNSGTDDIKINITIRDQIWAVDVYERTGEDNSGRPVEVFIEGNVREKKKILDYKSNGFILRKSKSYASVPVPDLATFPEDFYWVDYFCDNNNILLDLQTIVYIYNFVLSFYVKNESPSGVTYGLLEYFSSWDGVLHIPFGPDSYQPPGYSFSRKIPDRYWVNIQKDVAGLMYNKMTRLAIPCTVVSDKSKGIYILAGYDAFGYTTAPNGFIPEMNNLFEAQDFDGLYHNYTKSSAHPEASPAGTSPVVNANGTYVSATGGFTPGLGYGYVFLVSSLKFQYDISYFDTDQEMNVDLYGTDSNLYSDVNYHLLDKFVDPSDKEFISQFYSQYSVESIWDSLKPSSSYVFFQYNIGGPTLFINLIFRGTPFPSIKAPVNEKFTSSSTLNEISSVASDIKWGSVTLGTGGANRSVYGGNDGDTIQIGNATSLSFSRSPAFLNINPNATYKPCILMKLSMGLLKLTGSPSSVKIDCYINDNMVSTNTLSYSGFIEGLNYCFSIKDIGNFGIMRPPQNDRLNNYDGWQSPSVRFSVSLDSGTAQITSAILSDVVVNYGF